MKETIYYQNMQVIWSTDIVSVQMYINDISGHAPLFPKCDTKHEV